MTQKMGIFRQKRGLFGQKDINNTYFDLFSIKNPPPFGRGTQGSARGNILLKLVVLSFVFYENSIQLKIWIMG
jgi:hypothetical protein